jgi:hypothetical protein
LFWRETQETESADIKHNDQLQQLIASNRAVHIYQAETIVTEKRSPSLPIITMSVSGSGTVGSDVYRSMVLAFRMAELRTLLNFAGKNRTGKKQDLQTRALDLVKVDSVKIKDKITEVSNTMYKQMGTAASVNPYDNGDNAPTIATGGNNSTSGGGSETPSPAALSPSIPATRKRDQEKERERQA